MLLNEVLNSQIPYDIVTSTANKFVAVGHVGDRDIIVKGDGSMLYHNSIWFVSFAEQKNGGETFNATNSGNELQVFSMVINALNDMVARNDPDRIRFTASKSEGVIGDTRAKLYARLAQRYKPAGYTIKRIDSSSEHIFELVKDGAEKKSEELSAKAAVEFRQRMIASRQAGG